MDSEEEYSNACDTQPTYDQSGDDVFIDNRETTEVQPTSNNIVQKRSVSNLKQFHPNANTIQCSIGRRSLPTNAHLVNYRPQKLLNNSVGRNGQSVAQANVNYPARQQLFAKPPINNDQYQATQKLTNYAEKSSVNINQTNRNTIVQSVPAMNVIRVSKQMVRQQPPNGVNAPFKPIYVKVPPNFRFSSGQNLKVKQPINIGQLKANNLMSIAKEAPPKLLNAGNHSDGKIAVKQCAKRTSDNIPTGATVNGQQPKEVRHEVTASTETCSVSNFEPQTMLETNDPQTNKPDSISNEDQMQITDFESNEKIYLNQAPNDCEMEIETENIIEEAPVPQPPKLLNNLATGNPSVTPIVVKGFAYGANDDNPLGENVIVNQPAEELQLQTSEMLANSAENCTDFNCNTQATLDESDEQPIQSDSEWIEPLPVTDTIYGDFPSEQIGQQQSLSDDGQSDETREIVDEQQQSDEIVSNAIVPIHSVKTCSVLSAEQLAQSHISLRNEIEKQTSKIELLSKQSDSLCNSAIDRPPIKHIVPNRSVTESNVKSTVVTQQQQAHTVQRKSNSIVPAHAVKKCPTVNVNAQLSAQSNNQNAVKPPVKPKQQRYTNVLSHSVNGGPAVQQFEKNGVTVHRLIGKHPHQPISNSQKDEPLAKQFKLSTNTPKKSPAQKVGRNAPNSFVQNRITQLEQSGVSIQLKDKPKYTPDNIGAVRRLLPPPVADVQIIRNGKNVRNSAAVRGIINQQSAKEIKPNIVSTHSANLVAQQAALARLSKLGVTVRIKNEAPPRPSNLRTVLSTEKEMNLAKMGVTIQKRKPTREAHADSVQAEPLPKRQKFHDNFAVDRNLKAMTVKPNMVQKRMPNQFESIAPKSSAGHANLHAMALKSKMVQQRTPVKLQSIASKQSAGNKNSNALTTKPNVVQTKTPDKSKSFVPIQNNTDRTVAIYKPHANHIERKFNQSPPNVTSEALAVVPAASIIPKSQCRLTTNNYQRLMEVQNNNGIFTNHEIFDCSICLNRVEIGSGIVLQSCYHWCCKECVHRVIVTSESEEIKCPFRENDSVCGDLVRDSEIRELLNRDEYDEYLRRTLHIGEYGIDTSDQSDDQSSDSELKGIEWLDKGAVELAGMSCPHCEVFIQSCNI